MGIEEQITKQLGQVNSEKTYIEKILARDGIKLLKQLQKKETLSREDIDLLQYLLNNEELKLHNLTEHQRYIHNKFYCWVEEMLKVYMMYLDYTGTDQYKACDENTQKLYKDTLTILSKVTRQYCFLFFHLARSSLSLDGWGIGKLLTNVVEYDYRQDVKQTINEPEKKKFFGMG